MEDQADVFLLIDAGSPLGQMPGWPAHVRAEYAAALRAAGVDMQPHFAIAEPHPPWPSNDFAPPPLTSIERIDTSVLALWPRATGDTRLRTSLAIALRESEEIRRLLCEP